jgi:nucleotide-binding universal stress UspA family protein
MRKTTEKIEPYNIQQALVAMELGPSDEVVLNYLDFFTGVIPTRAIYFLHVLPQFDVLNAALERSAESMVSNVELNREVINQMHAEIKERMSREKAMEVDFDVREGNPLEGLIRQAKESKTDLIVIGQKSGTSQHGILAKNLREKLTAMP